MEERTLFDRIHQALDAEPRPGAYERLRIALTKERVEPQRWPGFPTRWPKTRLRLAAVMTLVVLVFVAAAAYLATRPVAERVTPADSEKAIAAYKLMLSADYNKIPPVAIEQVCFDNQFAACEADVNIRIPVANQIQNDLNRFQAPLRFAIAVSQMRRHNALQIVRLNSVLAASRAQDTAGMDRSVMAVVSGRSWMDAMFNSIFSSQQGTVASYVESLRSQSQFLDQCAECQNLVGQSQISCIGSLTASCQASLRSTAAQVGSFQDVVANLQDTVIRVAAPSALAMKDNRLQLDLAKADNALLTMTDALSAGDQARFNAGRVSLQQAVAAVNVDTTDILIG